MLFGGCVVADADGKNGGYIFFFQFFAVFFLLDLCNGFLGRLVGFQFDDDARQVFAPWIKDKVRKALAAFFFSFNLVLISGREICERYHTGEAVLIVVF